MNDIFVTAIYCDDIRQEMGGKHSFMGVYNADLVVPEFPRSLPKLCTHVTVRFPVGASINQLIIRVLMDDAALAEIALPDEELQKMIEAMVSSAAASSEKQLAVALAVQFAPLQLERPGVMRVRALIDDMEYKGNGLTVRLPTEAERSSIFQIPV